MSMDEDVKGPREYIAAVMRRKLRLIIPAIIIVSISLVVASVMPAVYRSTGTVLIEEPEVPREFIRSTITSFAAERLQVIQQRVMTTQNLISIINKFSLYAEERKRRPSPLTGGGSIASKRSTGKVIRVPKRSFT